MCLLQDISFISHCSPSLSTSAPPLTVDNVLTAVQGVHWRTLGWVLLARDGLIVKTEGEKKLREIAQQLHQSDRDRLHTVVKTWVQGSRLDTEPSWRSLILRLDGGTMTGVADSIRRFAEPVLGKSCDSISVSTFLYSVSSQDDTHASMPHINMCTTTHIETIVRIYSHLIYSTSTPIVSTTTSLT